MQSNHDQRKAISRLSFKPIFTFQPRWKEELVVTSKNGSFILDLSMGILSAYLPTQNVWHEKAPIWAKDSWPELKQELEAWCKENNAKFIIDATAIVYSEV